MIQFERIQGGNSSQFTEMLSLYKAAFPPEERRSSGDLQQEILRSEHFHANLIVENDNNAGLFNYWVFERFYYIEHFAITPQLRGKKIGERCLQYFKEVVGDFPILFEVEMPNSFEAGRRIEFYKRAGFRIIDRNYLQPSYRPGGNMIPMLLMSDMPHYVNRHFAPIKQRIYHDVYHFEEGRRSYR